MARTVTTSALRQTRPEQLVPQFLCPFTAILAAAIAGAHPPLPSALEAVDRPIQVNPTYQISSPAGQACQAELLHSAAAAVLCVGGILEGVLRSAPGYAPSQHLAAELEGLLHHASDAALAWEAAACSSRPEGGQQRKGSRMYSGAAVQHGSWGWGQDVEGCRLGAQSGKDGNGQPAAWELQQMATALFRDSCSLAAALSYQVSESQCGLFCQLVGVAKWPATAAGGLSSNYADTPSCRHVVL